MEGARIFYTEDTLGCPILKVIFYRIPRTKEGLLFCILGHAKVQFSTIYINGKINFGSRCPKSTGGRISKSGVKFGWSKILHNLCSEFYPNYLP